jgi:hypothetical protein
MSIIDENKNTYIQMGIAIKDNKTYLLDYKTDSKESPKRQVEKYESLLEKMGYEVEEKSFGYLGKI